MRTLGVSKLVVAVIAAAWLGGAEGSMGPKVRAACWFAQETGGLAVIGAMQDAGALLRGEAGTTIAVDAAGLELAGVG